MLHCTSPHQRLYCLRRSIGEELQAISGLSLEICKKSVRNSMAAPMDGQSSQVEVRVGDEIHRNAPNQIP